MRAEDAKWLLEQYLMVDRELVRIVDELEDRVPEIEASPHQDDIGRVIVRLSHAVDRVLKEHPELRPAGMDE